MLLAVIYWPPLAQLFHTQPLSLRDWLIAAGLGLTILPVVEVAKWIIRRIGRRSP
jgi:Ca2+-transporting ATPase